MQDIISFRYDSVDFDDHETSVTMTINDELFLDRIMRKFEDFIRAIGFDYVRMYETEDGEWVFDKNNHLSYAAACDCEDEEYDEEYDEEEYDEEYDEDEETGEEE